MCTYGRKCDGKGRHWSHLVEATAGHLGRVALDTIETSGDILLKYVIRSVRSPILALR